MKKESIVRITKLLLDFMFFSGILVTVSLPFTLPWVADLYLEALRAHYAEYVIIYFALGILAVAILGELRKMFRTVLKEDCFVDENVATIAMSVVTLVFMIAGLFSKVLAFVFEEAIRYKKENDLTI